MKISILTAYDGQYGTGHYQRMAALLLALNNTEEHNVLFISETFPDFIPAEFKEFHMVEIPADTELIIRDMRDSNIDEIEFLRKTAPVLAIDDIGPGRFHADYVIDLLPNKLHLIDKSLYRPEFFIYGYGFTSYINSRTALMTDKFIDAVYYPGAGYDEEKIFSVASLFPPDTEIGILMGEKSFYFRNGKSRPMDENYTEVLLKSKILVTHFGISMYEAIAAKCEPVIINPSEYHRSLTKIAADYIKLHDLGIYGNIDIPSAEIIIKKILSGKKTYSQEGDIKKIVNSGLRNFTDYIDHIKKNS